ncbi:excisionase [Massilia sp. S19_KUP03_FR1]|uniref:excisionase n=1 Tax=Massilia sp. S19_KUP03_FR1 TaxID=3025503 RepID=UPI002FCD5CE0
MVAKLVATIEKNARVGAAKAASKTYPLTWVKLDRYVELSGDSVDAVQSRRHVGKWIDGVQCKIVDGRLWINLPAVEEWIEKWDQIKPARAALNYGKEPKAKRPG